MVISELTQEDIIEYLRIDEDEVQTVVLTAATSAAEAYITGHTGLTKAELDLYPDITVAYLALIQSFYDNRGMEAGGRAQNPVADSILAMHARNLI